MEEAKEKPVLRDEDGDGAEDEAVAAATGTLASSPPSWWFFTDAHPCSLMQYAVRACAGCLLRLCGGSGRDDRRHGSVADASDDPADASSQRNAGGGGKANLPRDLVGSQLLVARRRPPGGRPSGPRPGRGGSHN